MAVRGLLAVSRLLGDWISLSDSACQDPRRSRSLVHNPCLGPVLSACCDLPSSSSSRACPGLLCELTSSFCPSSCPCSPRPSCIASADCTSRSASDNSNRSYLRLFRLPAIREASSVCWLNELLSTLKSIQAATSTSNFPTISTPSSTLPRNHSSLQRQFREYQLDSSFPPTDIGVLLRTI